ncbi:MAG: cytochrome c oxidase subunit II [Planctomycetaceae bacterium]
MSHHAGMDTTPRVRPIYLLLFLTAVTLCGVAGVLLIPKPIPASQHGMHVDRLRDWLTATLALVLIACHAVLIWLIWRAGRTQQTDGPSPSYRRELLAALIPVTALTAAYVFEVSSLGGPVWEQIYGIPDEPQSSPMPLEVEVVGKQFEWLIRMPGVDRRFGKTRAEFIHETRNPLGLDRKDPCARDDLIFRGVLRLPRGTSVDVRTRSLDVQHAMSIPDFRVRSDLIPGRSTHTGFVHKRVGAFEMVCSELCGIGHYKMQGRILVLPQPVFAEWISKQHGWFE